MALIFGLSSISDLRITANSLFDAVVGQLAHAVVFGVLALLLAWAWEPRRMSSLLGPFVVTLGYAVVDEIHQAFVPGRHPDVVDVAFDAGGAAIALAAWWTWRMRRQSGSAGQAE